MLTVSDCLSSRCAGSITSQGGYVFKSDTLPGEGAGVGATITGVEGKPAVYVAKYLATALATAGPRPPTGAHSISLSVWISATSASASIHSLICQELSRRKPMYDRYDYRTYYISLTVCKCSARNSRLSN